MFGRKGGAREDILTGYLTESVGTRLGTDFTNRASCCIEEDLKLAAENVNS